MKTKLQLTENALEAAKRYINYLEEAFDNPETITWNKDFHEALAELAAVEEPCEACFGTGEINVDEGTSICPRCSHNKEQSDTITLPRELVETSVKYHEVLLDFMISGRLESAIKQLKSALSGKH